MLKSILLSLLFCAGLSAETPTFGDIPWGSSFATAKSALLGKGYSLDPSKGENAFIGTLAGVKTQVFIYEVPGRRVSKVVVHMLTKDEYAISTYKNVREILIKRLGDPSVVKVDFTPPSVAGDGNELQAIKLEKATVLSIWPYNDEKCGVMVEITPKLTVQVTYDTNAWAEHIKRVWASEASVL